jgi:glucose-6-phosphate 1-dehydrogenase
MIQNHLLQVLSLIAMEPPVAFNADEIRARKVDVLRAIRPLPLDNLHRHVARGQYAAGWLEGEKVTGYRNEPDVAKNSPTETFAALKLFVDNWRWQDVPFYVRTGKRLPQKASQAVIQFRPVPHQSFPAAVNPDWRPNRIEIDIQPDEGIVLRFQVKLPGVSMRLSTQEMRFCYAEAFQTAPPEAYETLLLDALEGDATPVHACRSGGGGVGCGWVGFDFAGAFGCPSKLVNDAAMQALGNYRVARCCSLGWARGWVPP